MSYGTKYPDMFAALAAPFEPGEVKARTLAGRPVHYITARTAMNRLDDVLGPENWWDSYRSGGENCVICALTVRLPDGSELTKQDAGGAAGMADAGDDDKSMHSDAFKRAAVKFGVARYLYRDGVPAFAAIATYGGKPSPVSEPEPEPDRRRPAPTTGPDRPPTTGKGLYAWTLDAEKRHEVRLLRYLNQWGKLQDYPGRMIDWDREMVSLAHAEACRKLSSIESQEPAEALS